MSSANPSADASRSKPRFLSRKQREQLALQKLEQKRASERQKQHVGNQQNQQFFRAAREAQHHDQYHDSYRRDSRSVRHRPSRYSSSHQSGGGHGRLSRGSDRRNGAKAEELQLIKDQYLGKKRAKKMIVPPSQKFKVRSSLYIFIQNPHQKFR